MLTENGCCVMKQKTGLVDNFKQRRLRDEAVRLIDLTTNLKTQFQIECIWIDT